MIKEPTGWVANCENCWKEISSNDMYKYYPCREDEFIDDLKTHGWVVDEEGEVYCCEECMKAKKEDETDEQ